MEEKKNKNTKFIVTIVVLIILLLGLASYIVYDKVLYKYFNTSIEENKINSDNDQEENLDINNDLVQNLYSIFRLDRSCYMNVDNLNNNNLVKLRIAYDNIAKKNFDSIECSKLELSDSSYCGDMTGLMIESYGAGDMEKFREYEKQNYTESISAKLIEAKVHELFGSDFKVNHESFGIGHIVEPTCYLMKYDDTNKIYAKFNCEGGGTCAFYAQNLISSYKKGDKLYIITNLISPDEKQTKVTYIFKKDKENSNYVFEKAIEE